MSEPTHLLSKVLVYCLVAVLGGVGWLASSFGHEVWQVGLGVGLVFLAAALVRFVREAPNPSIERTVSSGLRPLPTAAHVKR